METDNLSTTLDDYKTKKLTLIILVTSIIVFTCLTILFYLCFQLYIHCTLYVEQINFEKEMKKARQRQKNNHQENRRHKRRLSWDDKNIQTTPSLNLMHCQGTEHSCKRKISILKKPNLKEPDLLHSSPTSQICSSLHDEKDNDLYPNDEVYGHMSSLGGLRSDEDENAAVYDIVDTSVFI